MSTQWFSKKQGLVLVEAGFGAGQMVIVTTSIFVIESFGWKWAAVILGCFLIVIVAPLLAILLKPDPAAAGLSPLGYEANVQQTQLMIEQQHVKKGAIADRKFWFLLIPYFICGFTPTGLMDTHLIPFAQYCGFSSIVTSAAVSTLAAFNIAGTVVSGILADRWDNKKILTFLYLARAVTIVFLMIFSSEVELMKVFLNYPVLLIMFSISFGLVDFATVAPTVKLLSDYYKGQSVGLLIGWLFMSHQLGSALGSYIPGLLFDRINSYQLAFLIGCILLIAAGILSALLPKRLKAITAPSLSLHNQILVSLKTEQKRAAAGINPAAALDPAPYFVTVNLSGLPFTSQSFWRSPSVG